MDSKNPYLIPIAILLAGLVLSITTYNVRVGPNADTLTTGDVSLVRPVDTSDHMLGNPEAPVMLVEYSDIDCEYCKRFQEVLAQIVTEYAPQGKVAWVYRHFPVVAAHPDAGRHAEAAECAAEIGGEPMFWSFINALHAAAPGGGQFNPTGYPAIANALGLEAGQFSACLDSNHHQKKVGLDFANALAIGAEGAPFTLILIKGAPPIPVSGYLPYEDMKRVVEGALSQVVE
jgi:protein-disulfide isomerase